MGYLLKGPFLKIHYSSSLHRENQFQEGFKKKKKVRDIFFETCVTVRAHKNRFWNQADLETNELKNALSMKQKISPHFSTER